MALELNYGNLQGHESMLHDSVRCEAFQKAIADAVTPGCVVLDVGAGTGILSLFAAQAGARTVYAVERTPIAELAQRIVTENGFGDTIRVLQNDIESLQLPEKVDVIVSEWLGGYGVDENLLPVVVSARDRWLKPGGRMIPDTVTSWLVPAYDIHLEQDIQFWDCKPYGVDLGAIAQITARQLDCGVHHVKQEHIICDPQLIWEVDAKACSREDAERSFACRLEFVANRDCQFNALAAWFRAQLDDNILLCNGPADRDTHWGRTIFPIGRTISVHRGMPVEVQFVFEPQAKGQSRAMWAVEAEGYRFNSEGITVLTGQGTAHQ
ncbi:MAG: methyltransferase domain-containing protein [Phycisphaerae bacterium]|nr:methyltransferase domain-containing protein [Phycisphaerae bacterium]